MWCQHCRQDTPGISSAGRIRCGRCGEQPDGDARQANSTDGAHPAEIGLDLFSPAGTIGTFEDWEFDHTLRSLQSRMGTRATPPRSRRSAGGDRTPQWRVDAAHGVPAPASRRRNVTREPAPRRSPTVTRSALWLGLLTLAGGCGLLGWSITQHQEQFFNVGLSAAVSGLVVFWFGLVLQLDRIWKNSRYAVQKLKQLDAQIGQLERTTSLIGANQGSSSQAFYAHMAEQANPHLLLADLKGQIDLLAMNFAQK